MGLSGLIVLGIIVQIVFLSAIFDIYFKSPIIHGVVPIVNNIAAPSQRVVVISVDGLRVDALLEKDPVTQRPVAPYIRWIMSNHSAWGVSHCHLPTESRPGHVAMLAGFYEDPSAVTKGWKENPVDFDSIFNRSGCSFSWGSPDIVDIFHKGLNHNCSFKWVYNESQDFAGNTMELDNWVLKELQHFFKASGNPLTYSQPKSLFFLHLLGQDTSGHTHKPKTELYRKNLQNVDRIVKDVANLFASVFRDNGTAFLLTADHGMTDWGSHGAGDPSETLTPIVAWGAGIKSNRTRLEINQADITPLLAVLLGVSLPVNSIGILPVGFLNMSQARIAESVLLNALQLGEQYLAKRKNLESKSKWTVFKNFKEFDEPIIEKFKNGILDHIKQGRFSDANLLSNEMIQLSLDGIKFYQNYYQNVLLFWVISGYFSWIIFLMTKLFGLKREIRLKDCFPVFGLISILSLFMYSENLPLSYHCYVHLPIVLIWLVFPVLWKLALHSGNLSSNLSVFVLIIGVEFFVLSFYFRWVLSFSFFIIISWPIFNKNIDKLYKIIYIISGIFLAGFSFLPVIGKQPQPGLIILSAIFLAMYFMKKTMSGAIRSLWILLAGSHSFYVHHQFETHSRLSTFSQLNSWALLLMAVYMLTKPSPNLLAKLENVFSSLTVPFLLLTISHEGFFLLVLFIHLTVWVRIEILQSDAVLYSSNNYRRRPLYENVVNFADLRRAYIFLAYILIAFFGLGNLATLNSFDPAWVRCFITTFSPFLMTGLILLKVVIPFFAVTLALTVITAWLNIQPLKLFTVILIYLNIMGLNFLFLVKNQGSWLEIGTSLSHYVIQQVSIVFILVLYFIGQLVIGRQQDLDRLRLY